MPKDIHKPNSSVEKPVPPMQKVWGSSLGLFQICFVNLHEFLHRKQQVKHESKTREVHEKWS